MSADEKSHLMYPAVLVLLNTGQWTLDDEVRDPWFLFSHSMEIFITIPLQMALNKKCQIYEVGKKKKLYYCLVRFRFCTPALLVMARCSVPVTFMYQ